jgi:GR25 family glycosyltransferase involved in LPS biosynthesis
MDIRNRDEQEKRRMTKIDNIYLINLDKRPDRLSYFDNNVCSKSTLLSSYTRYAGIDGSLLSENILYSIITDQGKKYMLDDHKTKGLYLTRGAIGLALTYKYIVENCNNNILILEDDIDIVDNFDNELQECLNNLPNDWDIFYLGWCDSRHLKIESVNTHINLLSGQVNGTHAWMINPRMKAKFSSIFPLTYQIDTAIYLNKDLIKYASYKKLVLRKNMGSDIQ